MKDKSSAWETFTIISTIVGFILDTVTLGELLRRVIHFQIQNSGATPSLEQIGLPVVVEQRRLIEAITVLLIAYTMSGLTYILNRYDVLRFWRTLMERHKTLVYHKMSRGFLGTATLSARMVVPYLEGEASLNFYYPYFILALILICPLFLVWFAIFLWQASISSWFIYVLLIALGNATLWVVNILSQEQWSMARKPVVGKTTMVVLAIETPLLIAGFLIFTAEPWSIVLGASLLIPFVTLVLWLTLATILLFLAEIHYKRSGLLNI